MSAVLRIAHIAVELSTALSIGSGRSHGHEDAPVALDHIGLPFIPGTTLAGVVRSLYARAAQSTEDESKGERVSELFGFAGLQEANKAARSQASRVEFSNGFVHASDGMPAVRPKIDPRTGYCDDKLLAFFQKTYSKAPLLRHRVKLTERGVSDSEAAGLFDRSVVPAGTRFTFEISLTHNADDRDKADADWKSLNGLFHKRAFRLGGATRAGLGSLQVIARKEWTFDLWRAGSFEEYRKLSPNLQAFKLPLTPTEDLRESTAYTLSISPEDFWRIGNADRAISQGEDYDEADVSPYVERKISWSKPPSKLKATWNGEYLLVPASSIKGALRHRTVFHLCRLMGKYLDPKADKALSVPIEVEQAANELFGSVKTEKAGSVGHVIIDDAYLPLEGMGLLTMVHNSIDRFTGGVRDGYLYGEQMAWRGEFELNVTVDGASPESLARKAFDMAIADLKCGRLTIGAASGRGHGRMKAFDKQEAAR